MGVRFDASGDSLSRTSGLPNMNSFTLMAWVRIVTDRNDYSGFFYINDGIGNHFYLGTQANGTTLITYNTTADSSNGTNLSVGTWYHVAMVCDGTGAGNLRAYLDGVLDVTHASSGSSAAATQLRAGNSAFSEFLNGRMAAIKTYSAVLTAAEIANEARQILPIRTANLTGFYPLFSTADDEIDFSGAGNNWTVNGTLATEDGPPIPWASGHRRYFHIPDAGGAPTGPPKKGTLALMGVGI